jgi:hypothetical protein
MVGGIVLLIVSDSDKVFGYREVLTAEGQVIHIEHFVMRTRRLLLNYISWFHLGLMQVSKGGKERRKEVWSKVS